MRIITRPHEPQATRRGEGWAELTLADESSIGAPAMVARRSATIIMPEEPADNSRGPQEPPGRPGRLISRMRKLWVVLGLVVFLLVAADVGLRLVAQYWVARAVQGSLGLDARPSVSLGGFPSSFVWPRATSRP